MHCKRWCCIKLLSRLLYIRSPEHLKSASQEQNRTRQQHPAESAEDAFELCLCMPISANVELTAGKSTEQVLTIEKACKMD
jgi:hypothetical protein